MRAAQDSPGRVRVAPGGITVLPPPSGPTTCEAIASIISPGTERRGLMNANATQTHCPGYMTLLRGPDGLMSLDPVPHGATFLTDRPRRLAVPEGTRLPELAAARFQLMAAVTLQQSGFEAGVTAAEGRATVLGSGPVAVGCVFELIRRGIDRICVISARNECALGDLNAVTLVAPGKMRPAACVIDCSGDCGRAMAATAKGGWLGVLGTPPEECRISALDLHRRGLRVTGLHELGPEPRAYRAMFDTVLGWQRARGWHDLLAAWCRIVPGTQAPALYRAILARQSLPPFLCLDWSAS